MCCALYGVRRPTSAQAFGLHIKACIPTIPFSRPFLLLLHSCPTQPTRPMFSCLLPQAQYSFSSLATSPLSTCSFFHETAILSPSNVDPEALFSQVGYKVLCNVQIGSHRMLVWRDISSLPVHLSTVQASLQLGDRISPAYSSPKCTPGLPMVGDWTIPSSAILSNTSSSICLPPLVCKGPILKVSLVPCELK